MARYKGKPQGNSSGRQRYAESLPKGEFRHDLPETEVDKIIRETFCPVGRYGTYRDLRKYSEATKEGMTRICYLAKWGVTVPQPERNGGNRSYRADVIIKVDKALGDIKSENGRRNILKGYNTANDIRALIAARHQNLARLIDFKVIPLENGETLYVSVEQYVDGVSLQKRVERKSLSGKEFEGVFKQTIEGLYYLIHSMRRFHRDIKPSNIVLGGEKLFGDDWECAVDGSRTGIGGLLPVDKLEVLVTDLSNSCDIADAISRRVGTPDTTEAISGAHLVTNPFLFGTFTTEPVAYDERSEMFSLGSCMYFALTGKYLFDCNRLRRTAVANVGGQQVDLFDERGKISEKKFRDAVDEGLREHGINRKYANVIKRCLLAPLNRGYKTIDDLAEDFDSLTDTATQKLKKCLTKAILPTVLAIGLLGGGYALKTGSENYRLRNQKVQLENQRKKLENENLEFRRDMDEFRAKVGNVMQIVNESQAENIQNIEHNILLQSYVLDNLQKDRKALETSDMLDEDKQRLMNIYEKGANTGKSMLNLLTKQKIRTEELLNKTKRMVKKEEQPQNGN